MFYWGEGDKITMIGSYQLGSTRIWGWHQFYLSQMDGKKWNECQGVNKMLNTIGSVVFQRRIHYAGTYHGYVTYVTARSYHSLYRVNSPCTLYTELFLLLCCLISKSGPTQLFMTPRTVAHQAPLSMEISKQEYWSGLPFLSPRIFLIQGSNRISSLTGGFFTAELPGKPYV